MIEILTDHGGTLGRVACGFPERVRAGELGRWSLTFHPAVALAAGSRFALARRWPSDWGVPQSNDPAGADYVCVETARGAALRWWHERVQPWHPFDHVLQVELLATVGADEALVVRYGDGRGGSPGARAQTFIEEASPISVRLRPAGQSRWTEIARPGIRVVGSTPLRLVATAPSRVVAGERFAIHVRIEDRWGNPASDFDRKIAVDGHPESRCRLESARGGVARLSLALTQPGVHRLTLADPGRAYVSEANPIRVEAKPATRLYWGDIHAQSVIGCGARTVENFYRHGRDFAALDFASHQPNCFLVSSPEWREKEAIAAKLNEDGRFVTLLGVEWSASYALGGDHNIYFPGDTAELHRCSHEYVADKSDAASDLPHIKDVHAHYRGSDTLIAVHVGGRTTNLEWYDDGLDRLLEVHSTHATSEWFLFDALKRGYRFGVTAGSDGVDGRPGASHPGHMAVRNVRGGLVAVAMPELSRASLWQALKAKRCYATTGERILVELTADGHGLGESYVASGAPSFAIAIEGTAPLMSVELFRGTEPVFTAPIAAADPRPSGEIRIAWSGIKTPGNFERSRMAWHGRLDVVGGRLRSAHGWAFDTPDEGIVEQGPTSLIWRSLTGGDWDGVVVTLDESTDTTLVFATEPINFALRVADLARGPFAIAAEAPYRRVCVARLPRAPAPASWSGRFTDRDAGRGEHLYWLRVRQEDGAYAWTSPIFVTRA
jgi:hypothetical protein